MLENPGDKHLIQALKEGVEDAFTTIYRQYWYQMFLVAYRKLQDKQAAEEIVQDIFMRLWKDRDHTEIVSLNYYLFSAVRYEVIDHIRRNISRQRFLDNFPLTAPPAECDVENDLALNELLSAIDESLHLLPEKSGEIFRLHRLHHWPVTKIAAHFSLSEKAIEYHLSKATKSVRSHLRHALSIIPLLLGNLLN